PSTITSGGVGYGGSTPSGLGYKVGNIFTISAPVTLKQVQIGYGIGATATNHNLVLYRATLLAGVYSVILTDVFTPVTVARPAGGGWLTIDVPPTELEPGIYFLGVQSTANDNHAVAYDNIYGNTIYLAATGAAGASVSLSPQTGSFGAGAIRMVLDVCTPPTDLNASNITSDGATISWTPGGSETEWTLEYSLTDDFADVLGTVADITPDPTYTFTGLEPSTTYYVRIKSVCGANESDWSDVANFTTMLPTVTVPYSQDFTNPAPEFTFRQNTTDAFVVGSTVGNPVPALYVSNDGGTSYNYANSNGYAVAEVLVNFGDFYTYNLSFDWRCVGEGNGTTTNYDYGKVYLVDPSNNISSNTAPAGALNTANFIASSTWQHFSMDFDASYANTVKKLVFYWRSDVSGNNFEPLAIDNIVIQGFAPPTCMPVTALAASNIEMNSADITWTAVATETAWTVEYSLTSDFATLAGTVNATSIPATLTGLTSGTTYYVRVKAICVAGEDESTWVTTNFTTLPDVCLNGITVGTGTITQSYVPVNSNYGYTYSQTIYLASELTAAGGSANDISKIAYQWNGAGNLTNGDVWTVYIGQTSKTTFSSTTDWVAIGNLQEVYTGTVSLPATAGWMTIELDNSFTWDGTSNIVVAVDENVPNYGSTASWYSTTGSNRTIYYYSDGTNPDPASPPTASGRGTSYPNMKFYFCPPPSCPRPTDLTVSNISATDAQVSWTAGGTETAWAVEYSLTSDFATLEGTVNATSTSITLIDLTPATTYYVRVKAVCGEGDESEYSNIVHFMTPCTSITTIPWSYGFEDLTADNTLNSCWSATNFGSSGKVRTQISDYGSYNRNARTGTSCIYFVYGCNDSITTPNFELTGGSTFNFSFYYVTDGGAGWQSLKATVHDATTGDYLGTIGTPLTNITNTTYTQYEGNFTPSASGTYYFVISCMANSSPWYLTIDDVALIEVVDNDVAALSVTSSVGTEGTDLTTVDFMVDVKNYGSLAQVNVPVKLEVDGAVVSTQSIASIASGTTETATFSGVDVSTLRHTYAIRAFTDLATDQMRANDTTAVFSLYNEGNDPCLDGAKVGTGAVTQPYVPVYAYYTYNYNQTIYLASDITAAGATAGEISNIAYHWDGNGNISGANEWTVYIGQTSKTTFSSNADWIAIGNLQEVYTGTVSLPASAGWMNIELTTPFVWDGTSNIVVAVLENLDEDYSSSYAYWTSTARTSSVLQYYTDTDPIDPANPPTTGFTLYVRDSYPNIRLNICPTFECPAPTAFSASGQSESGATLSWTPGGSETEWIVEYSTSNTFEPLAGTENVNTPTVTLSGLTENTIYYVCIMAVCGTQQSDCLEGSFTTLPTNISNTNGNQISITQNNGQISVSVTENSAIRIIDVAGRVLSNNTAAANSTITFYQPAGLYLIEVRSNSGITAKKLLVK
ncbi:MAG: fibronectin type III domain-containing protein, partial [Paludibacter sp.]|nr:fibronectin type III domain-containing protein [Paludibacter sp.]